MTVNEFLSGMQDVLQIEKTLTLETVLSDLEEWDSLAIMSTMAFLDKNFHKETVFKDYKNLKTLSDIAKLAGVINEWF